MILASAGGWDNTINLWDVTIGASFATLGYTSGFHSVSFSDDGRILAAGTKEGTVELWDTSGWLEARLEVVVEIDIPDSAALRLRPLLGHRQVSPLSGGT